MGEPANGPCERENFHRRRRRQIVCGPQRGEGEVDVRRFADKIFGGRPELCEGRRHRQTIQERWRLTQGKDPLFAPIDGANCPLVYSGDQIGLWQP